jgi:antidote-toxin recognition MazE-like antitoxin/ribbon-helix-helix CopG family protein
MTMSRVGKAPAVLTVRIGADLTRSLTREARRRRKTKSEVAREILAAGLGGEGGDLDLAQEARRQSLLVSRRRSEREILEFVEQTADTRGWK